MKRVVLIGCGSKKKDGVHKAKDLYDSDYFRKKYAYALTFDCPIFILSAKHHLLNPEAEIGKYNESLKDKTATEKKEWTAIVLSDLKKHFDLNDTQFVILAGDDYCKYLEDSINPVRPLKGMKIGEQNHFLTDEIKKKSVEMI